jgi:hypothetical protein
MLIQDSTVNSLFIECGRDEFDTKATFRFFEQLMQGFSIQPNRNDVARIVDVAAFLENPELLDLLLDEPPIQLADVSSGLQTKFFAGRCLDAEIAFLVRHFFEVDVNQLKRVDVSILERIVSSSGLRLISEDSLLDFILGLDCDHRVLLSYLRPEYLGREGILHIIDRLAPSDFDPLIWPSLCRRLVLSDAHSDLKSAGNLSSRFGGAEMNCTVPGAVWNLHV